MFNLPVVLIFFSMIALIFAYNRIDAEKLSYKRYAFLVVSPPILIGLGSYINQLYRTLNTQGMDFEFLNFSSFISITFIGFLMMAPALFLYATILLSMEKKSTSAWKLFIKSALVSALVASPYMIVDVSFGEWLMTYSALTGTTSMVILYYFTQWRTK